jgi:hypothetical protein
MLSESTCQALRTTSSGDRSNLDLGKTEYGIFSSVDDVALDELERVLIISVDLGLTARAISKPPPSYCHIS